MGGVECWRVLPVLPALPAWPQAAEPPLPAPWVFINRHAGLWLQHAPNNPKSPFSPSPGGTAWGQCTDPQEAADAQREP